MNSDKSKVFWEVEEDTIQPQVEDVPTKQESSKVHQPITQVKHIQTAAVTLEHTREQWLAYDNLADIASLLTDCCDADTLNDIRICMPPFALKAAAKLLPRAKLIQIKEWVMQLNARPA